LWYFYFMLEIQPIPGNKIVDGTETPLVAYRLSHAVMRWNVVHPDEQATFEVYANKNDAQPPIGSRDAEADEIYTRMSYPKGQSAAIQEIEMDVSYVDSPGRTS
jgi:hypothetical protein